MSKDERQTMDLTDDESILLRSMLCDYQEVYRNYVLRKLDNENPAKEESMAMLAKTAAHTALINKLFPPQEKEPESPIVVPRRA